jgi:hypothetical protein
MKRRMKKARASNEKGNEKSKGKESKKLGHGMKNPIGWYGKS